MVQKSFVEIRSLQQFFIEIQGVEDAPVILYVSDGPGIPETLLLWQMAVRFEHRYTILSYDQRGTGRTYTANPQAELSVDQLYEDLEEIVSNIVSRYHKKIILMGHGWGSILASRYARKHPENLEAYIGYSQITDMTRVPAIRCRRVMELATAGRKKGHVKTLEKIAASTQGTFEKNLMTAKEVKIINGLLTRYKVAYASDQETVKQISQSPQYEMSDLKTLMAAPKINADLVEYRKSVNLFQEDRNYQVPVLFLHGDWDYQNPFLLTREYCEAIEAPKKSFVLIEGSTANIMFHYPTEFWQAVQEFLSEEI